MKILIAAFALMLGVISAGSSYAGGLEQDTRAGNAPAAESGGSGR